MAPPPQSSPLAEELNLLFAVHELCSETTSASLDWLERQHLQQQRRQRQPI